ncbi:uncharacterized protein LOC118742886 [Rhagoletis pomonella]|uniref:uncharacterized protein LOC118742886 n=1 Tax=Rhagoletis pomonella TaxID=28610 RepID=UPI001785E1B8|nr:uncharacterized protein LOC118742886 [Rhagoletis pomonella]
MTTPEIVVKTEVDFDYIANYTGDGDTQNSQSSQSAVYNTKPSCCNIGVQHSAAQLETGRSQYGVHGMQVDGDSDHTSLMKLLKEFDLEILFTTLKLNDITFRSLKYLTVDDINAAIRHLGYRAEFREKLFAWRNEKFPTIDNNKPILTAAQQLVAPTNVATKRTPTSIVAPAISVQSLQQLQATPNSLQTVTANATTNNAIATPIVTPSNVVGSSVPAGITTTPTTGSATIIKRNMAPAEDFLSMLPGVSGTTARMGNNMPAVVLEPTLDSRGAFSFMPQSAKAPKRHSMATINTPTTTVTPTTTAIAATMATRASTKTINAEQNFMLTIGGVAGEGSSNASASGSRVANVSGNSSSNNVAELGHGGSSGMGYSPKGPLIMNCAKVDTVKVLQSSHIGQRINQFYNKNGYLENHQRNEIVRLIVADVMRQGETLCPKDLRAILSDIITLFPNEQAAADYYFIYRGGKGNPLGRLYQRYSNENVKRRRMIRLSDDEDCSTYDVDMTQQMSSSSNLMDDDDTMSTYPPDLPGQVPRVDEMTALALKQLLTTDHFSWEEVCDKWIQTWALRQKELQQSGLADLLTNWSKLGDPRAAELYKIDFRHVYPEKENLLIAKWDEYIRKVTSQFDKKLNQDDLKKLYKYCKMGMASKDEKDFVYAVGLTALLPCTSRFKDHYGKLSIRANLTDSIDSFVMRLNSLESYESRLDLYNRKYGPVNRTTQPFLVVIMPNECTISKIYVALENHFYCMQSFLQALDLCYKIYHTCGLKYPTMCENVWTFIQRFFYDMTVPWEARNANLVSLMVSLTMRN